MEPALQSTCCDTATGWLGKELRPRKQGRTVVQLVLVSQAMLVRQAMLERLAMLVG
jgi:hypothetical protein